MFDLNTIYTRYLKKAEFNDKSKLF